jgi:hypothetical protein
LCSKKGSAGVKIEHFQNESVRYFREVEKKHKKETQTVSRHAQKTIHEILSFSFFFETNKQTKGGEMYRNSMLYKRHQAVENEIFQKKELVTIH